MERREVGSEVGRRLILGGGGGQFFFSDIMLLVWSFELVFSFC